MTITGTTRSAFSRTTRGLDLVGHQGKGRKRLDRNGVSGIHAGLLRGCGMGSTEFRYTTGLGQVLSFASRSRLTCRKTRASSW